MKRAILTEKEGNILDNIIVKFGMVVAFQQILDELKGELNREYVRKMVSKLVENGWLVRLKNGVYGVSDLFNRGNVTFNQYVIANTINANSYVSFGLALQYYGMYDQLLTTVTSVSFVRSRDQTVSGFKYSYITTQKKFFFGFENVNLGNTNARIASVEKALIDMIQYSRTALSVDMVIEKLKDHKDQINFVRLEEYLKKSPLSVVKVFGFIFDLLKIDSENLYEFTKKNRSVVLIDKESEEYNSRWNVYYNKIFNKYL